MKTNRIVQNLPYDKIFKIHKLLTEELSSMATVAKIQSLMSYENIFAAENKVSFDNAFLNRDIGK